MVLISFAKPELAQTWRTATAFPFPLLLDPERRAYAAFGLRSSVVAAWHPKMFLYYFRLLARGRKLMPVRDDPYQLGGDFLLDRTGQILLGKASEEPTDRPTLVQLQEALPRA